MAGQPRKRAMKEELDRRTREFFDDDPSMTPLDYAEALIASGTSIRRLADSLTKSLGWPETAPVNREMLRRYLMTLDVEHYSERMEEAQAVGAEAYAESSIDILDDAKPDEASLAAAKSRARQWIAEKYNRKKFGRDATNNVVLNVGQLMLQALELPPPPLPAMLVAPTVDAEVISVEPAPRPL